MRRQWAGIVVWACMAGLGWAQPEDKPTTGPEKLPAVRRLPNQWGLSPAGQMIPLGEFPLSLTVSPDGRWGAVVHCGTGPNEVRILDLAAHQEVSSAPLANAWSACAWSPDARHLYVSRGAGNALARFKVQSGVLSGETTLSLAIPDDPPLLSAPADAESTSSRRQSLPHFPAAVAISGDGRTAYVADMYANRLLKLDLPGISDSRSELSNLRSEIPQVVCHFEGTHAYPHDLLLHPTRPVAYVSLWGSSAVCEVDLRTGAVERIATDPHPGAMAITRDGRRLFVACANSNHVDEIDTRWREVTALAETSLYPNSPVGSTPGALALSKNEVFLAVANSDNNDLAIFDIRHPGEPDPLGYVPTGAYPAAVAFTPDEGLAVINALGEALPLEPVRARDAVRGSAQFIPKLDAATLWRYTQSTYRTSPLRGDFSPPGSENAESTSPIPRRTEDHSPIFYVVCIIKGGAGRTYDQVLGDLPAGNGDASLCAFPEPVSPNHHALARDFVLLDNFYAEGRSPAEGRERSAGAYATDFVMRLAPSAALNHGPFLPVGGGLDPVGAPSPGYIWNRAAEGGVQYRSWGAWSTGGGATCDGRPLTRMLDDGHIDPCYPAPDIDLPDVARAEQFLKELDRYNREAVLPRLTVIHLPGGAAEGGATSTTLMAEQDRALGMIVDGLARSRFWKALAFFVVEESAAGPDHIHPQRSVALVGGPFARRGAVVSTRYSTSSALRTIELILGLEPLSQFDSAARPLYDCFTDKVDLRPYQTK